MAKYLNPLRAPEILKEIDEVARKKYHDMAKALADLYCSTLKSMILTGSIDFSESLSGKENKNKRKYRNRKQKLAPGAPSLVFSGQYVESIQVFEDTKVPTKGQKREEAENSKNYPRYYIAINGYNGIYGYYVDVPDIAHDPNVIQGTEFAKRFHLFSETEKAKRRKTKEYAANTMVSMRWLKRALEYGAGYLPPRPHWGYLTDIFNQEYGVSADFWRVAKEEAKDEIQQRILEKLGS